MIRDIIGILPPLEFTLGRRYSFLQDIKNAGSYIETKKPFGTEFEVQSKEVNSALIIRNANLQAGTIALLGEPSSHTLWGTIENIIDSCNDVNNPNPMSYIALKYLYVEADITIKQDIVPNGIRLANGTLTFKDWGANTDNYTPTIAESLDGTKIIYAVHLVNQGQGIIEIDELKKLIEFRNTSDKNVRLMCHFEYQQLINSAAYNNE